jgi:DUF1009 family protein
MSNVKSTSATAGLDAVGLIAGSGVYPRLFVENARRAGVKRIVVAAFEHETDTALQETVDVWEWMRVGQLGRMIKFFQANEIRAAVMAGQIAPRNLFDLRPDFKALLVLAKLKERNAESIFGAIAAELDAAGVTLLPATTFLEDLLAPAGRIAGPLARGRVLSDIEFGARIAREISGLDIGQTVLIRNGTVLAVEGFDGTNATIRRGGELGRGEAVMVKVSKPNQDMRFDVPVIGMKTLEVALESRVRVVALETGKTLLLEKKALIDFASRERLTLHGFQ